MADARVTNVRYYPIKNYETSSAQLLLWPINETDRFSILVPKIQTNLQPLLTPVQCWQSSFIWHKFAFNHSVSSIERVNGGADTDSVGIKVMINVFAYFPTHFVHGCSLIFVAWSDESWLFFLSFCL